VFIDARVVGVAWNVPDNKPPVILMRAKRAEDLLFATLFSLVGATDVTAKQVLRRFATSG
jgi:hypothetical protein